MVVLPPGTLLQLMYLDERLKTLPAGRFIEIGPGSGEITKRLLDAGWTGAAYDLAETTAEKLRTRFPQEVTSGQLQVKNFDFLQVLDYSADSESVDLIISCMVIEHFDEDRERAFMASAARCLRSGGIMIGLVPASERHWGIEDEVAGHCRRYTRRSVARLCQRTGWYCSHIAGLTYPVSNLLLPLSNFLVSRHERSKLKLSAWDRTKMSGDRNVPLKTRFPSVLALVLNTVTLRPLHWIQKIFRSSESALVLYFEAKCLSPSDHKKAARGEADG